MPETLEQSKRPNVRSVSLDISSEGGSSPGRAGAAVAPLESSTTATWALSADKISISMSVCVDLSLDTSRTGNVHSGWYVGVA